MDIYIGVIEWTDGGLSPSVYVGHSRDEVMRLAVERISKDATDKELADAENLPRFEDGGMDPDEWYDRWHEYDGSGWLTVMEAPETLPGIAIGSA